jgi:protein gp37
MADVTSIEWTDATWNVVNGCSVISPGCKRCYAMRLAGTRLRHSPSRAGLIEQSAAGPVWNGTTNFLYDKLDEPLSWQRPRMIFANAHGDLFHETVDVHNIALFYGHAIAAVHLRGHIIQILTKRGDRARAVLNDPAFWEEANAVASAIVMDRVDPLNRRSDDARATLRDYDPENPPPGIWLGVSAENQHWLMQRAPHLVETPAAVRFLSYEPALRGIDIEPFVLPVRQWSTAWHNNYPFQVPKHRLDWVICGGESGPGARPMHPDWARAVRDQCAEGGVPFFFKQWGEWAPGECATKPQTRTEQVADLVDDRWHFSSLTVRVSQELHRDDEPDVWRFGKKAAGRWLDGVLHDGMPS